MNADVVVIGAGTVGAAIAYGLASRGVRVILLDGHDRDFRAATANFGLIWQQGKGIDLPAYQRWTRGSVKAWHAFADELFDITGIDLQYEANGGLMLCLGEAEFEQRRAVQSRLLSQLPGEDPEWTMLDRAGVEEQVPGVRFGPEVTGAGFGFRDGHANPLRLLAALRAAIVRRGGTLRAGSPVHTIRSQGEGHVVGFGDEWISCARIVIAAGLGTAALASQVGLDIPIRPQRGQILVTERVQPFLRLPMSGMRQTREGSVLIGLTHEDVGLDTSITSAATAMLSANAIRRVPALAHVKLVRQWAGLRIMTPDGYPVYAESETYPGVFAALCHSGITLAAAHASLLADAVAAGSLPSSLEDFHQRRFDVPKAA